MRHPLYATSLALIICAITVSAIPAETNLIIMVDIPGGSFVMGSSYEIIEKPNRTVTVSPFTMAKYETTYNVWKKVADWAMQHGYDFETPGAMGGHLFKPVSHDDNEPVTAVNWYCAVKWCNAASEMHGLRPCYYTTAQKKDVYRKGAIDISPACVQWNAGGFRLPTEAEWEYACRAGSTNRYYWGIEVTGDYFWNYANCGGQTHPVGQKKPNTFGLYDMSGNASEWCFDFFDDYDIKSIADPKGPPSGEYRIQRGGGIPDQNNSLRSSARSYTSPLTSMYDTGFRVVRSGR
ncbi:MAG: SUMF1/EgtB/PvdO family nonheme iron enzyme [Spirochaetes bacterium]|nr:SUMF1/EgtB/PvdO family nonheme iron enzyme [Spirochaetota bacterium]